jgi:hypothetical protein
MVSACVRAIVESEIMDIRVLIACAALAAPCSALSADSGQQGMTVVRDAQTGKLRAPTPEESRALRALRPPPRPSTLGGPLLPSKPKAVTRADGTRAINLGERGLVYAMARRNADGSLSGYCVKDADAAAHALATAAEAPHDHQ